MTFPTRQDELVYFQRMRAQSTRRLGPGVLHPDQCPKLTLHGVEFAIPPRGLRVAPRFGADGVSIDTSAAREADEWAEAANLLLAAPIRNEKTCPRCSQPTQVSLELDVQAQVKFLALCFSLAAKLLRRQHDLSEAQLVELLSFDADTVPEWIGQLLRWAAGRSVQGPLVQEDPHPPRPRGFLHRLLLAVGL